MKNRYILFFFLFNIVYGQDSLSYWQSKLKEKGDHKAQLNCYNNLIKHYNRNARNLDSATYYVKIATPISEQIPHSKEKGEFIIQQGTCYNKQNNFNESKKYFEQAAKFAQNHHYENMYADAIIFNHTNYEMMAKYEQGANELFTLIPFLEKNHDSTRLSKVFSMVAADFIVLNNFENGFKYIKKQGSYCRNTLDSVAYFENLGHINRDLSKWDEAIDNFNKAISLAKKAQNTKLYIHLLLNQSTIYTQINKSKEALAMSLMTLEEAKKFKDSIFIGGSLVSIGYCYNALGQYQTAIPYLNQAVAYFKRVNNKEILYQTLSSLSTSYEGLGKYKAALTVYRESVTVMDSLLSDQNKQMMANYESHYQLKEKENEIALKEAENQLQMKNVKREKQQKYLFALLSILAICSFLWALWNYRKIYILSQNLRKQKEKVEEQAAELQKTNQMKDKLFAMLGHDLRTPVANLVNSLNLWEMGLEENKENRLKVYFTHISKELQNTQLILNNLLQWAMLNMKSHAGNKEEIALKQLMESSIKQLESVFLAKKLKVIRDLAEVSIFADDNQLQIVLRNILSNAIKFTPEKGYIKVSLKVMENRAQLCIQDTGMGISGEQINQIFHFPTSQRGTQGEKGTGIGLSLCKELVEKNGGTIEVKSEVGNGTEVYITFPLLGMENKLGLLLAAER